MTTIQATRPDLTAAGVAQSRAVRAERARLRERVYAGDVAFADVLLDPPECMKTIRVDMALHWLVGRHEEGRARVARLNLRAAAENVNLLRSLGELTPRQREWLVEHLPELVVYRGSRADRLIAAVA